MCPGKSRLCFPIARCNRYCKVKQTYCFGVIARRKSLFSRGKCLGKYFVNTIEEWIQKRACLAIPIACQLIVLSNVCLIARLVNVNRIQVGLPAPAIYCPIAQSLELG